MVNRFVIDIASSHFRTCSSYRLWSTGSGSKSRFTLSRLNWAVRRFSSYVAKFLFACCRPSFVLEKRGFAQSNRASSTVLLIVGGLSCLAASTPLRVAEIVAASLKFLHLVGRGDE